MKRLFHNWYTDQGSVIEYVIIHIVIYEVVLSEECLRQMKTRCHLPSIFNLGGVIKAISLVSLFTYLFRNVKARVS